jgi:hypothetical protein
MSDMSWYKKIARMRGGTIPMMDDYSRGHRPEAEDHKEYTDTLTRAKPEFGGNERPGYPKGISQNSDNSDDSEWSKLHGTIPGEPVLMDDEENDLGHAGDSSDGLGDRFTARGEGISDDDTLPIDEESERLDNVAVGPHNMPKYKGDVFNKIKRNTKIKGLRL